MKVIWISKQSYMKIMLAAMQHAFLSNIRLYVFLFLSSWCGKWWDEVMLGVGLNPWASCDWWGGAMWGSGV